jgi:hypothetical protein
VSFLPYILYNVGQQHARWVGGDQEGSGRGLFQANVPAFVSTRDTVAEAVEFWDGTRTRAFVPTSTSAHINCAVRYENSYLTVVMLYKITNATTKCGKSANEPQAQEVKKKVKLSLFMSRP